MTSLLRLASPLFLFRYPRPAAAFWKELRYLPRPLLPVTYNDKMFWRRLFDHNPRFVEFCDKHACKSVFQSLSDPIPTPQTLWVGDDPRDYPDALMRDDVIAKQTAGCNQNWHFAQRGKDREAFERKFDAWLGEPFGQRRLEWAYSIAPRRVMAEELVCADPCTIQEIKVQVIGGQVYYAMIYTGEKTLKAQSAIFAESGERLSVTNSITPIRPSHALPESFRVPECYDRAMKAAREIGRDLDYVRVDFMVADGELFGGEITPYPSAGLMTNSDPEVLRDMGKTWPLKKSWFYQTPQMGWRERYRREFCKFVDRVE